MIYEVEVKIELTKDEKEKLLDVFKEKGFKFKKTTSQKDFYLEANKSQYYDQCGGYNIRRYRDEGGELIYTGKIWEMVEGHLTRLEDEYNVTKEKFDDEIKKFPNAAKIEKNRDWFDGEYEGKNISITIDTVKFSHSPDTRYFIEAEIRVEDKNKTKETKDFLISFMEELLGRDEIVEAPTMSTMILEGK